MNWSNTWDTKPTSTITLKDIWDKHSQDDVLLEWDRLKKYLALAKETEMEFRKYVVGRAFPDKQEGVNTVELGNGYELKANIKFNYKLADNDKVEAALEKLAATDNNGPFLADRIIEWTPRLSLTEYRQLEPKYKRIVDEIVTIVEATPSLEIKAPKK